MATGAAGGTLAGVIHNVGCLGRAINGALREAEGNARDQPLAHLWQRTCRDSWQALPHLPEFKGTELKDGDPGLLKELREGRVDPQAGSLGHGFHDAELHSEQQAFGFPVAELAPRSLPVVTVHQGLQARLHQQCLHLQHGLLDSDRLCSPGCLSFIQAAAGTAAAAFSTVLGRRDGHNHQGAVCSHTAALCREAAPALEVAPTEILVEFHGVVVLVPNEGHGTPLVTLLGR
mmetsp:Transcript_19522/g.54301  ORF Transcript_19522/g.54301 Transcript_19522/m.54301 type:complete len:232 (-) Transcript_19522:341-1036(-)